MSVPALRQPKFITHPNKKKAEKYIIPDPEYVIVTLKGHEKLVVLSDAYHSIISIGDMYKCVVCQAQLELNINCKETHKTTTYHKKMLAKYPHDEEYASNLIRKVADNISFCTICNVSISNTNLFHHLQTNVHVQELERAVIRASAYKPH